MGELFIDCDGVLKAEAPDRAGAAELSEYMERSGSSFDPRGSYVPGYDKMCSRMK